jgi:hypothetical protein
MRVLYNNLIKKDYPKSLYLFDLSTTATGMEGVIRPFLGRRNAPTRTASAKRVLLDLNNGAFECQRIA